MTDTYYDSAQGIVLSQEEAFGVLAQHVVKRLMNFFKTWETKKSMMHRKCWNG